MRNIKITNREILADKPRRDIFIMGPVAPGCVYFLLEPISRRIKIGWTCASTPYPRIREIMPNCPVPLVLLGYRISDKDREDHLHTLLWDRRVRNEWFDYSDPLVVEIVNRHIDKGVRV